MENGSDFEATCSGFPDDRLLLILPLTRTQIPEQIEISTDRLLDHFLRLDRSIGLISEAVMQVMSELSPRDAEFHDVRCTTDNPAHLPTQTYYFMNVLGRAQRIDWLSSRVEINLVTHSDRTTEIVARHQSLPEDSVKMRARRDDDPHAWLENESVIGGVRYSLPGEVILSDWLWHELNKRFPHQLEPRRISCNER